MTENEVYERCIGHFKIVRRYADHVQCNCPAHSDKQASLTISKGRKCVLFHCHAGCTIESILLAVGIEKSDTFFESISNTSDWKKYIEKREGKRIEGIYPYVSCNGNYAFHKIRLEGKRLLYGRLENGRFTYGLPRNTPRKSMKAVYGDLRAIKNAIQKNIPIFIPEGEKDVNTLTEQGYIAFTYGGCGDWQKDFAELVKGANIFILADNDEPGVKVAKQIFEDLEGIANKRKIIVPMLKRRQEPGTKYNAVV